MKKINFFVLLLLPLCSIAQTELDPVTVTASLTQSKLSTTGRDIVVIKGEQFKNLPVHSIDELLRYVPGVEVQQRGPQGAQSDILIRGGTFQQVLVILDGIRLNDPLTGHFNGYIPVTPFEIDRIEIVKGTVAAVYGSDAVGGVIHIITKTFAAKENYLEGSGSLTNGEHQLLNGAAGLNWRKEKISVSAGVLTNNSEGVAQRGMDGYFHNTTVSGSFRQELKNISLGLQSSYDRRNFAAQNFYTGFVSDTATEKVSTWWNHVQVNYKDHFRFDAGYKKLSDIYLFSPAAGPNANHSSLLQAQGVYACGNFTAGGQFINRAIRSNDRGNHGVTTAAAFIVYTKQWGNFHFNPALRWEKGLIPQLSLAYKIRSWVFRATGGKSIRDADFTERYNNYGKGLVTSGSIGNPDLKNEVAWNGEVGTDFYYRKLKVSATFFHKHYTNLIDFVGTSYSDMPRKVNLVAGGNYLLASNIAALSTTGVETNFSYRSSSLDVNAGVTIINSSSAASLYISSHAKLLFTYSVIYKGKFFNLGLNGLYKVRSAQAGNSSLVALGADYFLLNGRLATAYFKKRISFFVSCDNILDRTYADRFGVPMPGRWWSGGVVVGWRKP